MSEFIHCSVCNTDHEALRYNGQLIAGCPEVPCGWQIPVDTASWFADKGSEVETKQVQELTGAGLLSSIYLED